MEGLVVLDNYDSFTFNLVHYLRDLVGKEIDVFRNDEVSVSRLSEYERIVLSPGPGIPMEAGIMPDVVRELGPSHKILGVCLGHQCIGEVYGATLKNLDSVYHGKGMSTNILALEDPIFLDIDPVFESGRYHSWVVDSVGFPTSLNIIADDDNGNVMALRHKEYDVVGVQFHPESVLTPHGKQILSNWLES